MLNLAQDKIKQEVLPLKKLEISDIEKFYFNDKKEFLIGLEYERLSLDRNTLENASYLKLEKIILKYCEITNWLPIYDNDVVIGAKDELGNSISLEPGCQLEISLAPKKDILSIELEASKILKLLDNIASAYNVIFLGYGISPISSSDKIRLLNKQRYKIMDKYLPYCESAELIPKMMRQTAGIQVNIDYKNNVDAFYKLKFLNLIMPFMAGLSANSPFERQLSDKKSIRSYVWRFCGNNRCKVFYKNIFTGFFQKSNLIKNYVKEVLNVPMIFIERGNKIVEINGKVTFVEFLKNGYMGYNATMDDYILHQSLCFPDVRFKKYIEIRNHDSSNLNFALALCAFYKGLFENDVKKMINKLSFLKIDKVEEYNKNIISFGLNYSINSKYDGWDIITILFNFAKNGLATKERAYLEPILNMIKQRKTSADIIIDYDYKNASDIVEFLY